jgi:predicted NBD/HSP70 family sugar kinase
MIALDIGGSKIDAVKFENGKIVRKERFETPKNLKDFKELISEIKTWDSTLRVAIAGFVKKGIMWRNYHIPYLEGIDLKKEFGFKTVMNDANSYALAQKGTFKNYLAITLGTGIGMGIVINEELYTGNGLAGELGHTYFQDKQFEELFSGSSIEKKVGYEKIPNEIKKNKKYYHKILSRELYNLILLFDPEAIYLGGGLIKFLDIKLINNNLSKLLPASYNVRILKGKKEVYYGLL